MEKIAFSIPGFKDINSPTGLPTGTPTGGFSGIVGNIVGVFIIIILIIAICFFAFKIADAAIKIITSGGDKQKFQSGRETLRYAIIGFIVIFLSFALVNLFGTFFGVDLLSLYK